MKPRPSASSRVRARTVHSQGRRLDPLARNAIDLFADVVARGGYSGVEAAERLRLAVEQLTKSSGGHVAETGEDNAGAADGTPFGRDIFSHVLAWWWTDPSYCRAGVPRPLRPKGPAPSIQALVRRIGKRLDPEKGIAYLTQTRSIRKVGTRYVPLRRWVEEREDPGSLPGRDLRALTRFLRTLNHNAKVGVPSDSWCTSVAMNARIPISKRTAAHEDLRNAATPFLIAQDAKLLRYERSAEPKEATVPMTINIWVSEGDHSDLVKRPRRRTAHPAKTRS